VNKSAKSRKPGRPKGSRKLPPGARQRMVSLTDAEFEAVKKFVAEMRGAKAVSRAPTVAPGE
jgi:hypothetical protein